jgi:hypothetical protein
MDNVTHKVFSFLDLNSRIELGLTPRKLPHEVISNLESKFPRPQLVYLLDSNLLLNFTLISKGAFGILHGVTLTNEEDERTVFDPVDDIWVYEAVCECGSVFVRPMSHSWVTDIKVKVIEDLDEDKDSTGSP